MDMSKEEFDQQFRATVDNLLQGMAENAAIDVKKFYSMTYFLENMLFFSPVLYDLIEKSKK